MVIDGNAYPVFCCKTWEFPYDQDEVEVTHINAGAERVYIPGMSSAMLSVTGITSLDNSEGKVSINYLMQQAIRRQIHTLRLTQTDDEGGTLQIEFNAFITNTTLSKATGSYSQSSATFRVTGSMTFSSVITPPVPSDCEETGRVNLTIPEGDTMGQDAVLIGADVEVLLVSVEGTIYDATTGTPGNRTYRHDSTTGEIILDPTNPAPPDGWALEVLYKINP